jgi:hypothetical protein
MMHRICEALTPDHGSLMIIPNQHAISRSSASDDLRA